MSLFDEYSRNKKSRDLAISKIQKIVKDTLIKEEEIFVPGKTKIPVMRPAITWQEINEAIDSILKSEFTMGKKVRRFEKNYAKYLKTHDGIMVNSGSSANLLALSILTNPRKKNYVKSGSEVICPAVGWSTTYFPIINTGLTPVFVDIELGTYNIDVEKAEAAVSKKTKIMLPVHLVGNPCNMDRICQITEENDLYLVEDTCEAHGSEYRGKKTGTFGDIGTFSFFMSHHMTTIEGGMLVTNSEELAEIAKNMRAFGWVRDMNSKKKIAKKYPKLNEQYIFYNLGYNLRPTEIAGAFGLQQLKKLQTSIKKRVENAKYWLKTLKQFDDVLILPQITKHAKHVWYGFPITVKPDAPFSKQEIVTYLGKKGVETRPLMSGNIVDHPSIKLYKHKIFEKLPNAELVTKNGFFFGNFPQMTPIMREYISQTISDFISNNTK